MIRKLKDLLSKNGYTLISNEIDGVKYNYCFSGDRIYFISDISNIDASYLKEYSNEMAINIAQLVKKDKYKEFFTDEINFSKEDLILVKKNLDLKAFLWDLYIINIRISDKKDFFSNEIISQVQREKLIARRIILQEETIEEVLFKLIDEFSPTDKLNAIVLKYREDTNESNIIDNLLNANLVHTGKGKSKKNSVKLDIENMNSKENILLKERINKIKKIKSTNINLDDIVNYLDYMKNLYEEAREYLKK